MKIRTILNGLLLVIVFAAFASAQTREERSKESILKVITDQQAAWNRGDIEGFMSGYWNSQEMTFISGDSVTKGWTPTLERYKRGYDTREKMGELTFSELQVTILSKKSAVVVGRFTLVRTKDRPTGMFTLTFRKFKDSGWKIILDHTS